MGELAFFLYFLFFLHVYFQYSTGFLLRGRRARVLNRGRTEGFLLSVAYNASREYTFAVSIQTTTVRPRPDT